MKQKNNTLIYSMSAILVIFSVIFVTVKSNAMDVITTVTSNIISSSFLTNVTSENTETYQPETVLKQYKDNTSFTEEVESTKKITSDKITSAAAKTTTARPITSTTHRTTTTECSHHKYKVYSRKATCYISGYIKIVCEQCGKTINVKDISKKEHDFKTIKSVNVSCSTDGYTLVKCSNCQLEKKINITHATGHQYSNWVTNKNPTYWDTGIKTRTCAKCGYKETVTLNKTTSLYPIYDSGSGYNLTITKEWYKNAWCYIAHIQLTDYSRFGTDCANGAYRNGYETALHACNRLGAILTVNGDYASPYQNSTAGYFVMRHGSIKNGTVCNSIGIYSSKTGLFTPSSYYTGNSLTLPEISKYGITDSFCFGPAFLKNGQIVVSSGGSRAQRTCIGTNGKAGDIWLMVSDGRNNDGVSTGLTQYECAEKLKSKGCTFGIPLDGGGSSTIVYRGHVLNAAKNNLRSVVDFVYLK